MGDGQQIKQKETMVCDIKEIASKARKYMKILRANEREREKEMKVIKSKQANERTKERTATPD